MGHDHRRPERLAGCSWVANDRLVCNVFTLREESGYLVGMTRQVGVDAAGGNVKLVSQREAEDAWYFSGFGAVTAEIYPTRIRGAAQGFTYNMGRLASAGAPFAVGSLARTHGFRAALLLTSVAFLLAALTWILIPETRGRELA